MKTVLSCALVVLFTCNGSLAEARDDAVVIMPDNPTQQRLNAGYCDAVVMGDTVYLSGIVAVTKEGDGSLADAYSRAFDQIGEVLKKSGASWGDVADITSFHTDMKAQMPVMMAVKNKHIRAPFPAWTAVQVVRLGPDNGITEIKIVAKLPPHRDTH